MILYALLQDLDITVLQLQACESLTQQWEKLPETMLSVYKLLHLSAYFFVAVLWLIHTVYVMGL